jgi:Magnesium transporter NIPA
MAGVFLGGVAVALGSTVFASSGLILQKLAHNRQEAAALSGKPAKPAVSTCIWWGGLLSLALSSVLSLVTYGLLGQALASAFAALTIPANSFLAFRFLGEKFTLVDGICMFLICAGITISVAFCNTSTSSVVYNVDVILSLLQRPIVYATSAVLVSSFFFSLIFFAYLNYKKYKGWKIECFVRAYLAGLFSGITGFCSKSMVVCIENMVSTKNLGDLYTISFWIFVLGLPASLVTQVYFLNSALAKFDAIEAIPPYQSFVVLVGVISGWIYFNEAADASTLSKILFVVGAGISVTGMIGLLLKKPSSQPVYMPLDAANETSSPNDGGDTDSVVSTSSSTNASSSAVDVALRLSVSPTKSLITSTSKLSKRLLSIVSSNSLDDELDARDKKEGSFVVAETNLESDLNDYREL